MTALGFFVACILIYNHEMSAAWYFIAVIIAIVDLAIGTAACQQGVQGVFNKLPGIRGSIDGGKPHG